MIAEAVNISCLSLILILFSLLPTFSAETGGKDLIVVAKSHSFSYFPSYTIIH